jgi:hypothetical protein
MCFLHEKHLNRLFDLTTWISTLRLALWKSITLRPLKRMSDSKDMAIAKVADGMGNVYTVTVNGDKNILNLKKRIKESKKSCQKAYKR